MTSSSLPFLTLDHIGSVSNKKVLLRLDLNLPLHNNRISDDTRLQRSLPTLHELLNKQAKIIILSHFGRPKGKNTIEDSLLPVSMLFHNYFDCPLLFQSDCIGESTKKTIEHLCPGSILLLENLRFYTQEEGNDAQFAQDLAELGDIYVNDAFSCSHRAHASLVGIPQHLPSYGGRALEKEVEMLQRLTSNPQHPIMAIIGGSKISTKLDLLHELMTKMDYMVLGGGIANTFLAAQGKPVGESIQEPDFYDSARVILEKAQQRGCQIILPRDVQVSTDPHTHNHRVCSLENIQEGEKIFDMGPQTIGHIEEILKQCKTVLWNGPVGLFEIPPYHQGSLCLAQTIGECTQSGQLISVAGGGETISLIHGNGLERDFTYTSTAGGAFLEWLEGKELPGITALSQLRDKEKAKIHV